MNRNALCRRFVWALVAGACLAAGPVAAQGTSVSMTSHSTDERIPPMSSTSGRVLVLDDASRTFNLPGSAPLIP